MAPVQTPRTSHPCRTRTAPDSLLHRFRRARRDPQLAVIEGFHALKHALRFGAEVLEAVTPDLEGLERLATRLAPDVTASLKEIVATIPRVAFAALGPHAARTGVMAIARRPLIDLPPLLDSPRAAPIVLLEDPRNLANMGACVRVAAAAGAAAVLTTGRNDPWQPEAVHAAAGLHFALPIARVTEPPTSSRPFIAVAPTGDVLRPAALPPRSILAFGTERYGLSPELLDRSDARVRIPMRDGVSSLNLATSVAAVLFVWRWTRDDAIAASPASGRALVVLPGPARRFPHGASGKGDTA
jgi:TrmH family RNA methyltransferase